ASEQQRRAGPGRAAREPQAVLGVGRASEHSGAPGRAAREPQAVLGVGRASEHSGAPGRAAREPQAVLGVGRASEHSGAPGRAGPRANHKQCLELVGLASSSGAPGRAAREPQAVLGVGRASEHSGAPGRAAREPQAVLGVGSASEHSGAPGRAAREPQAVLGVGRASEHSGAPGRAAREPQAVLGVGSASEHSGAPGRAAREPQAVLGVGSASEHSGAPSARWWPAASAEGSSLPWRARQLPALPWQSAAFAEGSPLTSFGVVTVNLELSGDDLWTYLKSKNVPVPPAIKNILCNTNRDSLLSLSKFSDKDITDITEFYQTKYHLVLEGNETDLTTNYGIYSKMPHLYSLGGHAESLLYIASEARQLFESIKKNLYCSQNLKPAASKPSGSKAGRPKPATISTQAEDKKILRLKDILEENVNKYIYNMVREICIDGEINISASVVKSEAGFTGTLVCPHESCKEKQILHTNGKNVWMTSNLYKHFRSHMKKADGTSPTLDAFVTRTPVTRTPVTRTPVRRRKRARRMIESDDEDEDNIFENSNDISQDTSQGNTDGSQGEKSEEKTDNDNYSPSRNTSSSGDSNNNNSFHNQERKQ
ncbi:Rab11 family-interacting protein 3, partial [Frankliniella fusca]